MGWPFRVSVRIRVLAAVIVVSFLGMVVTGGIAFVVQDRLVDAVITNSLEQEVAEFRTLATQGVDPETGAPFASIERLLRVALQRNVPDRNETYLTIVDGRPLEFDGGDRPIRLEEEPAVLAAAADVHTTSDVVIRTVATAAGSARLAIIPVGVEGEDATGALVIAYAVDRERADLLRLARIYLLASAGSLVLVAVVGWLVAGRLLRPLGTLREATQRISETDLTERIPVKGNDDITDLTRTYNSMLDRLQEALDTQRRFLDDAGHELRTPLTIVRGHLELLDSADVAEVEQTRALVIDEVDRMGRMVQDLILLSKARRSDFLIVDLVDLGSFTDAVLDKVRALGERQWVQAARAEGYFVGDAQRLTQALVELAHNAVKFSAAGSVVSVGSEVSADEVRLWITDEGRGIDPEDLGHVFDRFGRASSGRGVDGSGLGLSIVAAIAAAHGGHVEVVTAAGEGSTFALVLPLGRAGSPAGSPAGTPAETREDVLVNGQPPATSVVAPAGR